MNIEHIFTMLRYGEPKKVEFKTAFNSGIARIRKICMEEGADEPTYQAIGDGIMVTLKKKSKSYK